MGDKRLGRLVPCRSTGGLLQARGELRKFRSTWSQLVKWTQRGPKRFRRFNQTPVPFCWAGVTYLLPDSRRSFSALRWEAETPRGPESERLGPKSTMPIESL